MAPVPTSQPSHYLMLLAALSLAFGILLAACLPLPPAALPLLLVVGLLLLAAQWLLRRGSLWLLAVASFFVVLGFLRAQFPGLDLLPEGLVHWGHGLAEQLSASLSAQPLAPESSALLHAMLLGQRAHLAPATVELYRHAGASHILALSGLHLTILFGLVHLFLLRLLTTRLRYLVGLLGLLSMSLYVLLTGFPVSLCRASLMMGLLLVAQIRLTGHAGWHTLGLTALLLLLLSPAMLRDVGFQLSFLAVGGILLLYSPLRSLWHPRSALLGGLWSAWAVGLSAQWLTLPLLLYYFGRFPLSGLLFSPLYILLATAILYLALLLLLFAPLGVASLLCPVVDWLVALQHGLMALNQ